MIVNSLCISNYIKTTTLKSFYPLLSKNLSNMGDRKGLPLEMVLKKLDDFAPQTLAESWDNVGLLIEPSSVQISTILLTNDLTENVMEEALEIKANLIISYHPPIFRALKSITNRYVCKIIITKPRDTPVKLLSWIRLLAYILIWQTTLHGILT